MTNDFRCDYCGKFIAYDDIPNKAECNMITPDSEISVETYEIFHKDCRDLAENRT